MQESIVIFNPGRYNTLKKLYAGNNDKTATEDDVNIVEAIRMLEENDMWVSSLKANPNCDEPEFIAVVWGTLHTKMLEDHDAQLIVDVQLSCDETNHDVNQNKRGIQSDEDIQKMIM